MNYVIIGNGVAGINAARELRQRNEDAEITIISKESDHFFSRTALMYVACGQMSETDIEPYPRDHYKRMNFNRITDEVCSLDTENQRVKIKSGTTIPYDKLLIASGSVARMADWPGQDLDGVGNFVTWQNLEWLREKLKTAKRACVVGGGLIGIEVAEVLLQTGIETSFLIREDYFWPVAMDKTESRIIVKHMLDHGCDVRLKTEVAEVVGRGDKVIGVKLTSGDLLDTDLVIFTIGVRPQTDWLVDSGIARDESGGIIVDGTLKTNMDNIYAAGDCTSVEWFNGVRRPEQLWYTSRDQGIFAGLNMAGDEKEYKRGVFYNSAKLFDIEYSTAGFVNFKFDGEQNWFERETLTNHTIRITYLEDKTVVGFNFLGRRWDHRPLVEWVKEKRNLDWVLSHLHEANFDEEFYPKFKPLKSA